MGIQVQKTESGWTVTKGDNTYSITDKNGNGKYDSGDLCKELSGSGNALSSDDFVVIKYQIAQLGDGATQAEMAEYSRYQERKAAQEKYQQQQEQYMQQFQPKTKKSSFWSKLLTCGQLALTAAMHHNGAPQQGQRGGQSHHVEGDGGVVAGLRHVLRLLGDLRLVGDLGGGCGSHLGLFALDGEGGGAGDAVLLVGDGGW